MMKTLEKRMAAREGFTLVELIVVIAILAILAAVAYPVYTGYINRAHDASALEQLGSIATAAQGLAAGEGKLVKKIVVATNGDTGAVSTITVYEDDAKTKKIDIDGSNLNNLLGVSALSEIVLDPKSQYVSGATWKDVSGEMKWNPGAEA